MAPRPPPPPKGVRGPPRQPSLGALSRTGSKVSLYQQFFQIPKKIIPTKPKIEPKVQLKTLNFKSIILSHDRDDDKTETIFREIKE